MAAASLSLTVENPLTAIWRFASWSEGRNGNTMFILGNDTVDEHGIVLCLV
jgi:hypothetical protein